MPGDATRSVELAWRNDAAVMRRCAEPGIPPTDPLAFVEAPVEAATRR